MEVKMDIDDFYRVCNKIGFIHRGARWDPERRAVDIDVHTKPSFVQEKLCAGLAKTLAADGWDVEAKLEDGHIIVSDRKEDGNGAEDARRAG